MIKTNAAINISNLNKHNLNYFSFSIKQRSTSLIRAMDGQISPQNVKKKGVLFVCWGNICRSPTAEAMFKAVTERSGVAEEFDIDSCGTGGGSNNWYMPEGSSYHQGDPADSRMTATAQRRGVKLTSLSRPLNTADFQRFDAIIAMDRKNMRDITTAVNFWAQDPNSGLDASSLDKVSLMCEYCTEYKGKEVPDPYFGGTKGFEDVLDILDDACEGLLEKLTLN